MVAPRAGDEQRDIVAFLSTPEAYGLRAGAVERIDTHISIVWLAGDRAFKLKRAVHFDYVDFSTIALRRVACEAEVRLNGRTAPAQYRGVCAVTREADGSLSLRGQGVAIDWLVEMMRFDQDTLFDRLAERGRLDVALMEGLAAAILRLDADATMRADHGGRAGMAWVVDGNALGFVEQGAAVLEPAACERLTADTRTAIDRHATQLDARRRGGLVRECHGDLHLRNICLLDGAPTIFDGVELNDDISCIDVLYDFAFLLMDLWRRDLRVHANAVFNEYMARATDVDACARRAPSCPRCGADARREAARERAPVQRIRRAGRWRERVTGADCWRRHHRHTRPSDCLARTSEGGGRRQKSRRGIQGRRGTEAIDLFNLSHGVPERGRRRLAHAAARRAPRRD